MKRVRGIPDLGMRQSFGSPKDKMHVALQAASSFSFRMMKHEASGPSSAQSKPLWGCVFSDDGPNTLYILNIKLD